MAEIKFEIKKNLGTLSSNSKGWAKEINLVSWNDRPAKADIRDWDSNYKKMGKGLTFTKEELLKLKDILNKIDFDLL